jgi:hypothetical protein
LDTKEVVERTAWRWLGSRLSLKLFEQNLEVAIACIPREQLAAAWVEIQVIPATDFGNEAYYTEFFVKYKEPETAEEVTKRLKVEEKRIAYEKQRELQQLEYLKQKYES